MKTIKFIFMVIPFSIISIPLLLLWYIAVTITMVLLLIWNWIWDNETLNYDVNYYFEPFNNWLGFIKKIIEK